MWTLNQLITFSSTVTSLHLYGPHFNQVFRIPCLLHSLRDLWEMWSFHLQPLDQDFWNLLVRALTLNVCLSKNDCIFNHKTLKLRSIILNISLTFVFWFQLHQLIRNRSWSYLLWQLRELFCSHDHLQVTSTIGRPKPQLPPSTSF